LLINEKNIIRLYHLELLAFAFLLPIYRKVVPYIIAMMVITWLFEGDFVSKARRLTNSKHRQNILLFAGIYVLYMVGLLYTQNFSYGLFDLEVKMSLFIFPVIFSSVRKEVFSLSLAKKVLIAFVLGVFASMILCYSVAVINYINHGNIEAFYYSRLSIFLHPSYLAMYVSFAIAILMYFSMTAWYKEKLWRALAISLVVLFELFIVMLSSKAGILGLGLVIALCASYCIFIEKRILRGILAGSGLFTAFIIFLMIFPTSASRFQQTREAIELANVNKGEIANSTGERIQIWWYSFEITNDNFLFGVGTGDVKDHLLEKYDEKGMSNALTLALNAHNQYLQTMITMGAVGLIVLLLNLILPALFSIDRKHYLYLIFLLLIGTNFLFESMLETQAGVVFYAFFNTYLFAIKKDPASIEAGS